MKKQRHPILAISYVLSRWGETSPGDLAEACRTSGIEEAAMQRSVEKLIELKNLKIEHGRYVWIGPPYAGG